MTDLKSKWHDIVAKRPDYDHPDYTIQDWKRAVFEGKTRLGDAEIIAERLVTVRPPLPAQLRAFKPKSNSGRALQRAAIDEFAQTTACFAARENGHGWFAMRYAFENLIPFFVAKGENSFIIAQSTDENKADAREIGAEMLYRWDGYDVPRFEDMGT